MTLYIWDNHKQITLQIAYQDTLFSSERIDAMLDQYRELLSQMVERPNEAVASYSFITSQSRPLIPDPSKELLEPRYDLVTEMFNSRAVSFPRQIAVTQRGREWSYEELNERAHRIACTLISHGIEPRQTIMVCGEKSFGMIASMLATCLSGGVLFTLDRKLPAARQRAMFDIADVKFVLYAGTIREQDAWMLESEAIRVFAVDCESGFITSDQTGAIGEKSYENSGSHSLPELSPNDPAYIFFTSGTTGVPKGVLGCHKGLSHFLSWQREEFGITSQDRCAQLTGLSFDVVLRDIFLPLTSGATVCLPDDEEEIGSWRILAWLERERISVLHTVPTVAQMCLMSAPPELRVRSLRIVFFAGEPLTEMLVKGWREVCSNRCEVINLYGPTETTLAKCYYRVPLDCMAGRQPVGGPIPHTQVLILRDAYQLCGIGEIGEVVIRTPYRTLGYINGSEQDRQRFVKNPFRDDEQDLIYHTGDLGRYRGDGGIELVGRVDDQVKIRGMRVEPGEIEVVLEEHKGVKQCAVIAREDERGDKRLVAYVVPSGEKVPARAELREYLQRKLPEYMVPSAFVELSQLPLTPNGKLDRKSLPEPVAATEVRENESPRTPVEEIVAGIWAEVLRLERVGGNENFFELGGHSILATQLISRVREVFQVEVPLRALFERPTVEGLAKVVEQERDAGRQSAAPPILPAGRDMELPLSFAQQRLWFIHQLEPESAAYNTSRVMRLRGALDISVLRQSLQEIARRHEVLRTRFVSRDGRPVQVIEEPGEIELPIWDISDLEGDERNARAEQIVGQEAGRTFDLERGPVWWPALVRMSAEDHMLLLSIHHIASDAWSASLLVSELKVLYEALRKCKPSPLPDLAIQYADFAVWQRGWLQGDALEQQIRYWKGELEGAQAEVKLPGNHRKPQERRELGLGYREVIERELLDQIRGFSRQQSVTMFITLLAAFKIVLMKWCGQTDITVGTVIANRNRAETERLIGCFMNFLPLRTQLREQESGIELLTRIKRNVLEAYKYQDCPFEKIVEAINPGRSGSANPLFNVGFLLQNVPGVEMSDGGIEVEGVNQEVRRALLDVRMVVAERNDQLEVLCEYSHELFEEETIKELVGSWREAVRQLVSRPEEMVGAYQVSDGLERVAEEAGRSDEQQIAIAATFTAEMVAETVEYWMEEFGIKAKVEFAPYNQVYQELLGENSLLSNNKQGVNVVLVRLEDWAGPGKLRSRGNGRNGLERNVEEFIAGVKGLRKRSNVGCVVVVCPATPDAETVSAELLESMARRIEEGLSNDAGVQVVSSDELMRLYPVSDYYDRHGEELGHVPYTRVMYAGLGTMIARKAFSFIARGYKAIALDCDGTLWKGSVAEDGVEGIEIDEGRRLLQEFMVKQQEAGRLICLCSKNNDADVIEVFERQKDMVLSLKHLASRRINWKPKSENLRSLAEELNIGLDSFIFIDDSDLECAEVEARCGDALVLQMPKDDRHISTWLNHVWAFDCLKITEEDRKRTTFYQQNHERERVREEAMTLEDFMQGLGLKVEIKPMPERELARVSQLTHRTNQFNNTGIELIEGEIERLLEEHGYECEVVNASDRFGEYGLVGVMIYKCQADALRVRTFLLSCRALGRGIEHQMLQSLKDRARCRGAEGVEIEYRETRKNHPARMFLDAVGANKTQNGNDNKSYKIGLEPENELNTETGCASVL